MKRIILILVLIGISTACNNDIEITNHDIEGEFTHAIANCDNSDNPELNCIEHLWLNHDSTGSIMYGGIDYATKITYSISGNIITMNYPNGNKVEFSLEIENKDTLIRLDNNDVWIKEK